MKTATSTTGHPVAAAAQAQAKAASRMLFIDNIRVFLTILVLLHHLMITYSGTGDWYYNEGSPDFIASALGGWFCATNQAYFMGLFLLISAYFVPGSYDRKRAGRFLKDRLVRLGIPLAVYSWIINPVFVYFLFRNEIGTSFWRFFPIEYFKSGTVIGHGPLWFVEVLLIFSVLYILWRLVSRPRPSAPAAETPFPSTLAIALFALVLGIVGFVVRLTMPMDSYTFVPLNLQLPFFAQYIAMFVVGLIAQRRNWLARLPDKTGRGWLIAAIGLILVWVPMMLLGGAGDGDISFKGGWNWQAMTYALWEAFACVALTISVIFLFRRYLNRQGKVSGFLIPNAYAAYIIHAPVIVALALAIRNVQLYPLLKWLLLAPFAVLASFGLAAPIRKIPFTERVL
jgi:surface polysaccharide O-acyltransferase-like enzyme